MCSSSDQALAEALWSEGGGRRQQVVQRNAALGTLSAAGQHPEVGLQRCHQGEQLTVRLLHSLWAMAQVRRQEGSMCLCSGQETGSGETNTEVWAWQDDIPEGQPTLTSPYSLVRESQERTKKVASQPSEPGLLKAKHCKENPMRENQEESTSPVYEKTSVLYAMCPLST